MANIIIIINFFSSISIFFLIFHRVFNPFCQMRSFVSYQPEKRFIHASCWSYLTRKIWLCWLLIPLLSYFSTVSLRKWRQIPLMSSKNGLSKNVYMRNEGATSTSMKMRYRKCMNRNKSWQHEWLITIRSSSFSRIMSFFGSGCC